jgi:hypothetical protein
MKTVRILSSVESYTETLFFSYIFFTYSLCTPGGGESRNQLCEFANFNSHARHLPLTVTFTLPSPPRGFRITLPPQTTRPHGSWGGGGVTNIIEELGDLYKVVFADYSGNQLGNRLTGAGGGGRGASIPPLLQHTLHCKRRRQSVLAK